MSLAPPSVKKTKKIICYQTINPVGIIYFGFVFYFFDLFHFFWFSGTPVWLQLTAIIQLNQYSVMLVMSRNFRKYIFFENSFNCFVIVYEENNFHSFQRNFFAQTWFIFKMKKLNASHIANHFFSIDIYFEFWKKLWNVKWKQIFTEQFQSNRVNSNHLHSDMEFFIVDAKCTKLNFSDGEGELSLSFGAVIVVYHFPRAAATAATVEVVVASFSISFHWEW